MPRTSYVSLLDIPSNLTMLSSQTLTDKGSYLPITHRIGCSRVTNSFINRIRINAQPPPSRLRRPLSMFRSKRKKRANRNRGLPIFSYIHL